MWIKDDNIYYTHSDCRRAVKGASLPAVIDDAILAEFGFTPVILTSEPEHDPLSQVAEYDATSGTQVWTVRDKTEAELHTMRATMQVSMRQARLALLQAGHLNAVPAAIAAIDDSATRAAAEIEWEYAHVVDRLSPIIATVRPLLGMTEYEMDQLFATAKAL